MSCRVMCLCLCFICKWMSYPMSNVQHVSAKSSHDVICNQFFQCLRVLSCNVLRVHSFQLNYDLPSKKKKQKSWVVSVKASETFNQTGKRQRLKTWQTRSQVREEERITSSQKVDFPLPGAPTKITKMGFASASFNIKRV